MRVPGFVHSPLLPKAVRGTINHKLFHITDWLPTIVGLARGSTSRNKALDGHDIWAAITVVATPSPRQEILHNINPACGMGFVNPNAGIRVGDFKLLVDCFNTSTLAPSKLRFPCHIPVINCSGAMDDGAGLSFEEPCFSIFWKSLFPGLYKY